MDIHTPSHKYIEGLETLANGLKKADLEDAGVFCEHVARYILYLEGVINEGNFKIERPDEA